MKVEGFLRDIGGADRITKRREEQFNSASDILKTDDPIGKVAQELHPQKLTLEVVDVTPASPTATKIRFVSKDLPLPVFQAGQYVSLKLHIGDTFTSRPYSICSAPYQARLDKGFIEITVRNGRADGFVANYLYSQVKVGDIFEASLPFGHFYYEELRDSKNIVGIAGGSGITPFYSMAQEIVHGTLDVNLTILYGSVSTKDIILGKELSSLVSDKFHFVNVISGEPDYQGEKGFISRDIIKKYSSGDTTYFVCGPLMMYTFISQELHALDVPEKRIRMEVFGSPKDVSKVEGYPQGMIDKTFNLTVIRGIHQDVILAKASEPVAVALERAGIKIETRCRSGACGYCRSKLLSGNIFVPKIGDGRRAADKEENYFHACSSYPLSDVTVKIAID